MKKRIHEIMTKHVVTIKTDTPFTHACRMFKTFGIHHLPVVDDNKKVIGIFSATDALQAYNDQVFNKLITNEKTINDLLKIGNIMSSHEIYYLNATDDIHTALLLFKEFNIHAVPVVENDQLVGIVTSNDFLNQIPLEQFYPM